MERRRFVGMVAGLSTGAAGCLSGRETGSVPAGMDIETRHWVADILDKGLWHQRMKEDETINRYHRLLGDETAAETHIDGNSTIQEFVRETDFDRSYLLVVQNMMQSARWLEIAGIKWTDSGLGVAVTTRSPDGSYGDDAAVHSLAIRLTVDEAISSEELTVTVDGKPTGT